MHSCHTERRWCIICKVYRTSLKLLQDAYTLNNVNFKCYDLYNVHELESDLVTNKATPSASQGHKITLKDIKTS